MTNYEIKRKMSRYCDKKCWVWDVIINGETRNRFGSKAEAISYIDWRKMKGKDN